MESRSRRGNLHIHGIPVPANAESVNECIDKIKDVLS